ncbi:hypothetical protein RDWZM_005839 [Blomia tropicalis]|uniref:Alkylglycerol monooxygenase n=1 Tax=Blomia tropicalis TaxID=40697 RepID=A0A9Q0M6R9_BLOTA|nr:hypothetical protein RDWZM_005839 [Blomia tropicalis]
MPLYSIWTWLVSLLLVEFVYYWTHRALHEFNILWAAHQFHHMAEDLNVSTAIRDSVVDLILYDIFPLPLSILIQPQILIVHMQFSLIYQIWLHNSVIGDLGFIEYIVNTPRQHLVHHGKNPYCIDKNYGALLMIWDRMFGTYQREKKDDELVFGVVSPTPSTFDPMILQFGYYRDVYNKICKMETFGDKMSALFKGPGWSPGKPRLGLISDVPEPDRSAPKYSYDPKTSVWIKLYVGLHGTIMLLGLYLIGHHTLIRFSYWKAFIAMMFLLTTLTSFGFIFDHKKFAPLFEVTRWRGEKVVLDIMISALRLFYLTSIVIWMIQLFTANDNSNHSKSENRNDSLIEESKKEHNEKDDIGNNIELAKKLVSKHVSKRVNAANIIASIIFLTVAFTITYVLYFIDIMDTFYNYSEVVSVSNESLRNLGERCARDFVKSSIYDILQLFYIVFPSENYNKPPSEVHNYELSLIPAVIVLFLGVMIHVYVYIYDNYRIIDLPLYSIWTWLLSLLLVEFVYYWTHRALHEFNILWAAHQFHHMAEDLNVTTTVRDSVVDLLIYDIFPIPLALLIQPQILVVHMQFSLIYQIWLHNSVVGNLGFIEYIVNTPRQHLVHHGKNPYCIDKNYGALLMIWDRMFGTYQREKKDDELVFGVVSPTPATFDPMVLQFGYYRDVYKKFCQMETFNDKMSALFKGPGWSPGKPRLGLISDVPEPDRSAPKYSYDPKTSVWIKLYVGLHGITFSLVLYLIGHHTLIRFSYERAFVLMFYLLMSLTSFGFIFDNRKYAPLFEVVRCILYFPVDYYIAINTAWQIEGVEKMIFNVLMLSLRIFYIVSVSIWLLKMLIKSDHRESMVSLTNSTQGKETVSTENGKEANGKVDLNDNIELPKKLVSKPKRSGFKPLNIFVTLSFVFLVGTKEKEFENLHDE